MKELDKSIKRKYSFSEYNPNWKLQFSILRDFILEVFGDKAIKIEHVGSTSVEGMKAKPLIDVLVIVKKMESFQEQKDKMTKAGYEWGENYIAPNTLLFFRLGLDGEKLDNIHICEEDSPKARQFIVVRDYLRTHTERAREYSDLKQRNAELYPDDYPAYRKAKYSFLQQLEKEAYGWAETK
ncbi:MAG: GrpB family protein [Patescibacteria group bacterium]